MILQSLHEYYQRKKEAGTIAPDGLIQKKIDFLIVLDASGRFSSLECLQEKERNRLRGKDYYVPAIGKQAEKHDNTSKDANLLWDKAEFVLGVGKNGKRKLDSFIETIEKYFPLPPSEVRSILNFLKNGKTNRDFFLPLLDHPEHGELIATGSSMISFRLLGTNRPVCCEPFVETAIQELKGEDKVRGTCLVTGAADSDIELTHLVIKGVKGAQSSGANLVSFNKESFLSHGWAQSQNAPVSKRAAVAYVKALNHLVSSGLNGIRVADTTTVFWSQKESMPGCYDFEQDFSSFFADPPKDDPDRGVRAIKALYEALHTGRLPVDEGDRFFVLGLAPNAARIAVRFWRTGTTGRFAEKIRGHFDDLEIVRGHKDPEYLTLNQILRATVLEYKMDNVPPNLAGSVVESILDGTPYPTTLLHQCIRRIRAERHVTRARAAILKACVNRLHRHNKPSIKEEMEVSLDRTNTSSGYRLGRIFAVLEKIQEEASPGINATIRDRFYGAASSSPVAVFPQLLKLKNHHLAKLQSTGRKVNLEKELGEIFDGVQDFPPHLSMEEQARFAIGYYHQRQFFFRKSTEAKQK